MKAVTAALFSSLILMSAAASAPARMLECPDGDAIHHSEATATSAPEIKVRAGGDLYTSSPAIKPLTVKALRLAREQRAQSMQRGIEESCPNGQIYIGEIPEHRQGCETRLITRPADAGHQWAQVIAICRYDWSCCQAPGAKAAGVTLEGPMAVQASTPAATSPAKSSKK